MIIVGGEALVDLVPTVAGDGSAALRPALGGGPFNAAIAMARLGADTGFLSRISTDGFGNSLAARLRDEGVDLDLVQRGDELTTLAVTDTSDPGAVRYGFYVNGTADRLVADPGRCPTTSARWCSARCRWSWNRERRCTTPCLRANPRLGG